MTMEKILVKDCDTGSNGTVLKKKVMERVNPNAECDTDVHKETKKDYVPFDELIEKFHKIREGRMKTRHGLVCDRLNTTDGHAAITKQPDSDVESDSDYNQSGYGGISGRPQTEHRGARRMSLPSLYRPDSIPPTLDSLVRPGPMNHNVHVGLPLGEHDPRSRRRNSLPYAIMEDETAGGYDANKSYHTLHTGQQRTSIRRRNSLPHAITLDAKHIGQVANRPQHHVKFGDTDVIEASQKAHPRRYSMPYIIKEYAKHDVGKLESELRDRYAPLVKKTEETDKTVERGINGTKLHDFYNLWEKKHKPLRKHKKPTNPASRWLEALSRDDDSNGGSDGRSRLNTF